METEINTNAKPSVVLSVSDKLMMLRGMFSSDYYIKSVRPMMYKKAGGDPERVQELVLNALASNNSGLSLVSRLFSTPPELEIEVNGRKIIPFGTAAGLDKTGDAMLPLSRFFGFLEPGTVIVNPREGNARPRVATDDPNLDIYNAQGFPSKGLDYFLKNIIEYRKQKGNAAVYVSICGMPISRQNAVELAMSEMKTLLKSLEPYVDGFVWNCASPNTEALKTLRDPQIFSDTSALMKELAPGKLRLVKIWPYEAGERESTFKVLDGFIEGGGHGIVTTNTKMFPKEQVPMANWGYKSAGRSGKFLKEYRLRSVKDLRESFPDSFIVAAGGIYDGDDAYETFKLGADMLEGYTPYAFYGIGLLKDIEKKVLENLRKEGYSNLKEMMAATKHAKVQR